MKSLATLVPVWLFAIAATVSVIRGQEYGDVAHESLATTRHLAPIIPVSGQYENDGSELATNTIQGSSTLSCDSLSCDSLCSSARSCDSQNKLPLWAATADVLLLNRSDPRSAVLAFNTANPAENLNASNFNFGVHSGFDLSLLRQLDCKNSLELRYFGIDHWRETVSAATTPGQLFQINAAVPVFTFSGSGVNADYASALHNSEINGRHRLNECWSVLAGFRYAELNERASASLVNSAIPFDYSASTRNRLYGFQLGTTAQLLSRSRYNLDAFGKAGIFGNSAAQNSEFSTGIVSVPANGNGSNTAFIGELGTTGRMQWTDHLALRGGYRLLWLDGVALASDQLAVSDFANGSGFNGSGNVFYHGAFAGLELAY